MLREQNCYINVSRRIGTVCYLEILCWSLRIISRFIMIVYVEALKGMDTFFEEAFLLFLSPPFRRKAGEHSIRLTVFSIAR